MTELRSRIVETLIADRLKTHGAVLVTGPKAVGKTTTARLFAASEVRLDQDRPALTAARTDPRLVLDGGSPRLVDEYQLAEGLSEAIRGRIDDVGGKGLFLLAGSATPDEDQTLHTGARRIAPVSMRTMTSFERGLSSGGLPLGALLDGEADPSVADRTSVPDAVRRLIASYVRNVATGAALRTIGRSAEEPLSEPTLHDYLRVLRRLFLIEDQESWKPRLRSRIRLAATPKRHLADPSLAVAALGTSPERLLRPEIKLAGLLFESQVIHDLRVYAESHRARVPSHRPPPLAPPRAPPRVESSLDQKRPAVPYLLIHQSASSPARTPAGPPPPQRPVPTDPYGGSQARLRRT